jgi:DNA polymerase-3 subunit epsilon
MPRTSPAAVQPSFEELGTPLRDVTFVVVDLETTGGRTEDAGITEIGAVKVRGGEVLGELQSLVNPGHPVPAFVARLTGITTAMVATAPDLALVLPSFLEFARGSVLVAHNAPFDVGFLRAACERLGYPWPGFRVVDTVPLARRVVTRDEAPNHKLATLAALFRARTTPQHRALADARATVDVLHGLLERLAPLGITHLEDLATAADPVPPEVRRKRHLADDLPEAPGVYLFRGPGDEVLYVGTSTNIRKRVRSYFTAGEKRRRITEMVRIAHAVTPVVCTTPLEAQVRELRLITEHAPRYNRRSKHPERHAWVRLTDEPYPRLSVVRDVRDGSPHIGPFASRRTAQDAVDALHDALALRQCTARLPRVARVAGSPCALAGMGRCSAPCTTTQGPDTSYAAVAREAAEALTGDASPVVRTLSDRIARLAAAERYEEAGQVTARLRAFVHGAGRAQRLDPLARCAELVAARATTAGGWEIVVVRYARLAATAITRPDEDPLPVVDALRATAEVVAPPVAPSPACHPEEARLVLDWLEVPGTRLVHVSDPWACPVRSASAHTDLAWASGEVRARVATMAAC